MVNAVRAGALAAGLATLGGVFVQGIERSGWVGHADIIGLSVMFAAALGSLIAIPLGWPAEDRPGLVARILITPVAGVAIGAIELAIAFLSKMRERNMPLLFVPLGLVLIAIGLRRLPENRMARGSLIFVAAVLFLVRTLQAFPPAWHAVERRIYPMTDAQIRTLWDQQWCRELCTVAKVVAFAPSVVYSNDDRLLASEPSAKVTLETTRDHVVDGCAGVHVTPPIVPEWASTFKTTAECFSKHPLRPVPFSIWSPPPSYHECCYVETRPRKVGERFDATGGGTYVLFNRQWVRQ